MGMHRRAFLQGAAIIAAMPVVTNLMSFTTAVKSDPAEAAVHMASSETSVRPVEFRVRGWHENDYLVPAGETISSTGPTAGDPALDQVLINVNQGWRSAWR